MLPLSRIQRSAATPFLDDDTNAPEQRPARYVNTHTIDLPPGDETGGLSEYWQMIRRGKLTLLLLSGLGIAAGCFLTRIQSPVYRARTLVEIENLNEDFLNIRNVSPTISPTIGSPDGYVRSQILILQSRPVLEKAIGKLDLEKRLVASAQGERRFPWSKVPEPPVTPADTHERALIVTNEGLKLRAEANTRMIEVTFESRDPRVAADVANAIPAGATDVILEKRWETSQYTSDWLNRQMKDLKVKLDASENELQRFARASNLTFLSDKDNVAGERLRQVQASLSKAHADRVAAQTKYERAARAPGEALPEVLDDPTLKDYEIQLTTLRRQLAELLSLFTKDHPKVATLQAQLTAVEAAFQKKRANIISRVKNEFDAAVRQEQLLTGDYSTQSRLVSDQANKIDHYTNLKHEVDTTRQLYDSMVQKVREASVASALRASEIHVIDSARTPVIPFRPNPFYNITFGLAGGLMVGMTLVIVRARNDRGVQGPGETSVFLQVPELGVIPASNGAGLMKQASTGLLSRGREKPGRLELTMSEQRQSVMAESFRLALTSILLSDRNGVRPHVIAVSSANPGEGKTMVSSNLAIALAEVKGPVLLIDGDLRRPRLHQVFEVDNECGLAEVLAGELPAAIQPTRIANLHLLTSGKRQDEGLFFASDLGRLIRDFRRDFDTILIDTPPLLQIADARLIARRADASILVVAQHTSRDAVMLARQLLAEDGSSLLGTILNNWDARSGGRSYQGYGYYSYYRKQASS